MTPLDQSSDASLETPVRRRTSMMQPTDTTIFQKLKSNTKFFKSPLFMIQTVVYCVGHCTVGLGVNHANDFISEVLELKCYTV